MPGLQTGRFVFRCQLFFGIKILSLKAFKETQSECSSLIADFDFVKE